MEVRITERDLFYEEFKEKSPIQRFGFYLTHKPGEMRYNDLRSSRPDPVSNAWEIAKPPPSPQTIEEMKREKVLHSRFYWIPRTVIGFACAIKQIECQASVLKYGLYSFENFDNWALWGGHARLFDAAGTVAVIAAYTFAPIFSGVVKDSYQMLRFTISVVSELRKDEPSAKRLLALTARISVRAISVIAFSTPALIPAALAMKALEYGADSVTHLATAKRINSVVIIETLGYAIPTAIYGFQAVKKSEDLWHPQITDFVHHIQDNIDKLKAIWLT